MGLVRFFETLPHLALTQISIYLQPMDLLIIGFLHEKWRISLIPKNFWRESLTMNLKIIDSMSEIEILRHDKRIVIKIHSNPLKSTNELELSDNEKTKSIIVFQRESNRNQKLITAVQHILSSFRIFLHNFELDDSGLTIDPLSLRWIRANLKTHNFTEASLNQLLIDWKEGLHTNIHNLVIHVGDSFEIGKILENVGVEPWNPEKRDRWHILQKINGVYPPPLDLAAGHDIFSKNGQLATVHLLGNEFFFFGWTPRFCMEFMIDLFVGELKSIDESLERKSYQNREGRIELEERRRRTMESLKNLRM